jgi:hypothetical protein
MARPVRFTGNVLTTEKKSWRCVQSGETPRLFGVDPPRRAMEAIGSST